MAHREDLTGQRFGNLRVIGQAEKTDSTQERYRVWLCRCDCGRELLVNTRRLKRGTVKDCGCIPKMTARRGSVAEDLTGRVFGHLTAIRRTANRYGRTCWLCRCDCGNETEAPEDVLVQGSVLSCGCLKRENQKIIWSKLHRVDGTCVEILENRKYRSDNTSGFRGVFRMKNGKYRVDIGFKGKRFYLGTFPDYDQAVQARMSAEELVYKGFLEAYYKWKERADKDPDWKEKHPLVFEVEKTNGELRICS